MAIKFICSCGKHLRARDEMAARRARCPRCGAPVGIPSLQPTHRGTAAAPMTPQERLRHSRGKSRAASVSERETKPLADTRGAAAPPSIDREQARRLRRMRNLETHWYQCLIYPFLVFRLLIALALLLTALSAGVVLNLPKLIPAVLGKPSKELLAYAPVLLPPLFLLAYTCAALECALSSALAGQGCAAYGPGGRVDVVLKTGLRWFVCWLAGPALLLAVAGWFWFYGGDPQPVDWLILAELGILAIGYWLLAIAVTNESGRLRDVNPVRVGQLLHRLGYRAFVAALLASVLLFGHAFAAVWALVLLHKNGFALALLLACWLSGLFWGTFLFRLLGVWCYRRAAEPPILD